MSVVDVPPLSTQTIFQMLRAKTWTNIKKYGLNLQVRRPTAPGAAYYQLKDSGNIKHKS